MSERVERNRNRDRDALSVLQRRWRNLALAWLAVLLALLFVLSRAWAPGPAARWAILAGALLAYLLFFVRRHLEDNRRAPGAPLLATLGPGNVLSLQRGLAIALVGGFIIAPQPAGALAWLPALLYTFADIADYFDGYLARRANHSTRLGEQLDIEFDGLGMLLVTLLAVRYGQLPPWYLALGLARYLFLFGLWWRERRALPVFPLAPSAHRRVFAGMQMGFMSVVLWPILPADGTTIAGTLFAIPTALGFLRDWLVVSGRLDPANKRYRRVQRLLVRGARQLAPPLLRLAVLAGMVLLFRSGATSAWETLFAGWGLPFPTAAAGLCALLGVATTAAVAAGILGRSAALFLLFPLGFAIVADGLTWAGGVTLAADIAVLLLGTGPLSLWSPEERYIFVRAGEPGFGAPP